MAFVDMALDELKSFRPEVAEPIDFDDFWGSTLSESRNSATPARVIRAESPLSTLDVYDVTFSGFGGQPVKAWFLRPTNAADLPLVTEYIGYGGGRGLTTDRLVWASAGFGHLVIDNRGQGGSWGNGSDTPDAGSTSASHPGFLTRGILDPHDHYYRRLICDAALALDLRHELPGIDPNRTVVTGVSQGGGLAIAAAGLRRDVVSALLPDVAFLCNIRRGAEISDANPYHEIAQYLSVRRNDVDQAFTTLSYIDAVNFSKRAAAPSLWSVGLMDDCCPPSTTFTAFNWYGANVANSTPPEMAVYPFNGHDGGGGHHVQKQLAFAANLVR